MLFTVLHINVVQILIGFLILIEVPSLLRLREEDTRYLTYVQVDKHIYHRGDTLLFRAFLLHAISLFPADNETWLYLKKKKLKEKCDFSILILSRPDSFKLHVTSPSGEQVAHNTQEWHILQQNGSITGSWLIPYELPGGDYKLHVSYLGASGYVRITEL